MNEFYSLFQKDREILRELGKQINEIGNQAKMEDRIKHWKKLNALVAEKPMVLTELSGVLDEVIPLSSLDCKGEWAKGIERRMRSKIFQYNCVGDDVVIVPRVTYTYNVTASDLGVAAIRHTGSHEGGVGSYRWDAPITDIDEGLKKLKFRELSLNREATEANIELLHDVFDGILPVEHRGWYFWTQGLTIAVIDLIGLDGLMYAMYDQPEQLHKLMGFMRDEQLHFLEWHEKQGLLFANNQDDYIGSGGCGFTDLLPQKEGILGEPGSLKDMWGLSESQETVGVSPDMFEEFVFQYQLPIISKFGLACYGCCEPIDRRWHVIKNIPNLRRVSVSPWANQENMAEYLGKQYIYSRKPNPTLVSTAKWDDELIRNDLRKTLEITKGMNLEIVLKDVHTLQGDAERLQRWVEIVREEIEKV